MSTLPGHLHPMDSEDANATCETCQAPATRKVQGETDSFGCEYIYFCDAHFTAFKEEQKTADHSGYCDWCKQHAEKVSHRRDFEEGMNGPVYLVCTPCIHKDQDRISELNQEAQAEWEDRYGPDDADDDFDDRPDLAVVIDGTANPPALHWHMLVKLVAQGRPLDLDGLIKAGYEGKVFDLQDFSVFDDELQYTCYLNEHTSADIYIPPIGASRVMYHETQEE